MLGDVEILEKTKSQSTMKFSQSVSVGWLYQDTCGQHFYDANPPYGFALLLIRPVLQGFLYVCKEVVAAFAVDRAVVENE